MSTSPSRARTRSGRCSRSTSSPKTRSRGCASSSPAKVSLNEETGQITTTFTDTPQVPFETLRLHFFEGPRASLSTPAMCGTYTTTSVFTPWSGASAVEPSPLEPFRSPPARRQRVREPAAVRAVVPGGCVESAGRRVHAVHVDARAPRRRPAACRVCRCICRQGVARDALERHALPRTRGGTGMGVRAASLIGQSTAWSRARQRTV